MKKNIVMLLMAFCVCCGFADPAEPNLVEETFPLMEGFPIKGVDGKFVHDENTDTWFFQPYEDITDGFGIIKEGQKVDILKSSMLEKMIDVHENQDVNEFRIWASTIAYSRDNSFYPIYFVPLAKADKTDEPVEKTTPGTDANESILPDDVLAKLTPSRAVTTAQVSEALASDQDAVLINRTGFVFYDLENSGYVLKLDSLGRNINETEFVVHKSRVLEFLRRDQRSSPSPIRFRFSGRITVFEGKRYILLHRSVPAGSYGNFGR